MRPLILLLALVSLAACAHLTPIVPLEPESVHPYKPNYS
jgi:hypothetical protein